MPVLRIFESTKAKPSPFIIGSLKEPPSIQDPSVGKTGTSTGDVEKRAHDATGLDEACSIQFS